MSRENAIHMAFDLFDPNPENADLESPPIIFLHCYTWNRKMYTDVVRKISDRTGRKIYSLDMRNHGDSPKPQEISTQLIHDDIDLFFKTHQISLASFVCHGYSCSAVALFACNNPTKVEKIAVVDYYPYSKQTDENISSEEEKYYKFYRSILEKLSPDFSFDEARQLLQKEFSTKKKDFFLKKILDELEKGEEGFKWRTDQEFLHEAFLRGNLDSHCQGPYDGEILFIRPVNTLFFSYSVLSRVALEFPNVRFVTMNDCTHLLIFEKEEKFVEEIRKFLLRSKES